MTATERDENNDRKRISLHYLGPEQSSLGFFVQTNGIELNLGHRHETATSRWFPNPLIFFRRRTLRCVLKVSQWILILNIHCLLELGPLFKIQTHGENKHSDSTHMLSPDPANHIVCSE